MLRLLFVMIALTNEQHPIARGGSGKVRIGVIMETPSPAWDMIDFSIFHANRSAVTNPTLLGEVLAQTLDGGHALEPFAKACRLLSKGIVALIAPIDPLDAAQIVSIGKKYKMPVLSLAEQDGRWLGLTEGAHDHHHYSHFYVNLHPPPRLIGKAVVDIVTHFRWRSFTILYEEPDDLMALQDLIALSSIDRSVAPKVDLVILPQRFHGDQLNLFLKDLSSERKERRFVVHLTAKRIPLFIQTAVHMDMVGPRYSYVFTDANFHTLKLDALLEQVKCNITGLSLVAPDEDRTTKLHHNANIAEMWNMWHLANNVANNHSNSKSIVQYDPAAIPTSVAVTMDTFHLIEQTLRYVTGCVTTANSKECEVPKDYEADVILCDAGKTEWKAGAKWIEAFQKQKFEGVTGHVQLNNWGQRENVTLHLVHYSGGEQEKMGHWNSFTGLHAVTMQEYCDFMPQFHSKVLRIVVLVEEPFVMFKRDHDRYEGNERYEGFCIDMLNHMSAMVGFNYTIHEVADGNYGAMTPSGEWNGMVGELARSEADLAVASITISSTRSEYIDFTVPFMHLGISILFQQVDKDESNLFAFLLPLSVEVWIYLLLAYLTVSLMMWCLARFSPYEWYNPHPHDPRDTADSQFTILNSLWFSVGSLMQQGSDVAPRAFSTRLVAAIWWFFTVVLISSYTAKLAAFLTVARMHSDVESADDLAKQEKVKYGSLESGSTMNFFRESKIPTYERMWQFMESTGPEVFVNTSKEGIAKVKAGNYAYLMESTMLEYYAERDCQLMQIGGLIDSKGYGIAMRKGSPYREPLSQALLQLQDKTTLAMLKDKWWTKERGGGLCKFKEKKDNSQPSARKLKNIGGIFFILFGGLALAFTIAMIEFIYKKQYDPDIADLSLCSALIRHMTFRRICTGEPSTPRQRVRRRSGAAPALKPAMKQPRRGHPMLRHEHMKMVGTFEDMTDPLETMRTDYDENRNEDPDYDNSLLEANGQLQMASEV